MPHLFIEAVQQFGSAVSNEDKFSAMQKLVKMGHSLFAEPEEERDASGDAITAAAAGLSDKELVVSGMVLDGCHAAATITGKIPVEEGVKRSDVYFTEINTIVQRHINDEEDPDLLAAASIVLCSATADLSSPSSLFGTKLYADALHQCQNQDHFANEDGETTNQIEARSLISGAIKDGLVYFQNAKNGNGGPRINGPMLTELMDSKNRMILLDEGEEALNREIDKNKLNPLLVEAEEELKLQMNSGGDVQLIMFEGVSPSAGQKQELKPVERLFRDQEKREPRDSIAQQPVRHPFKGGQS